MQDQFNYIFRLQQNRDLDNTYASSIGAHINVLKTSLDPTDELLASLKFIWTDEHITEVANGKSQKEKSTNLWNILRQKTTADVETFLAMLREHDQDHVANVLQKLNDKVPMSDEHVRLLDVKRSQLVKCIDPRGELISELISNGIFTDSDKDRVCGKQEIYDEMAEEIVDILRRKSDCCFGRFVKALSATHQSHVAYILTGEGDPDPPICNLDIERITGKVHEITQFLEPISTGLLEQLARRRCFNDRDRSRVQAETTRVNQIRKLLELLKRKSQRSFDQLKCALERNPTRGILPWKYLEHVLTVL